MEELQKRMSANIGAMDPEQMMKTWLPTGIQGWEQMQKAFWAQMANKTGGRYYDVKNPNGWAVPSGASTTARVPRKFINDASASSASTSTTAISPSSRVFKVMLAGELGRMTQRIDCSQNPRNSDQLAQRLPQRPVRSDVYAIDLQQTGPGRYRGEFRTGDPPA